MRVTSTTFLPVLVAADDQEHLEHHVVDEFLGDLAVAYSVGPPFGERMVTWSDLDQYSIALGNVRRTAALTLGSMLDRVRLHGQPPALMLSFDGLESSVLLAHAFWDRMEYSVPGELVVGVPARDVVIVTGSESRPGLEKARRAVDRVFFAGDQHLLSRELLVRRRGVWDVFRSTAARPSGGPSRPPAPRPRTPGSSGRPR